MSSLENILNCDNNETRIYEQSTSDEENFTLDQPKKRRHGGPKRDEVWEYVNIGESLGDGHYRTNCKYSEFEWTRGRPQILKRHLARDFTS